MCPLMQACPICLHALLNGSSGQPCRHHLVCLHVDIPWPRVLRDTSKGAVLALAIVIGSKPVRDHFE